MRGELRARLERRAAETVVAAQYARHPLRLFTPDGPAGDPARLLVLGVVGGGVRAGDDLDIELHLGPGAHALATGQAATKLLAMADGCARQRVALELQAGAVLEYLPDEVIPFAGACARFETRVGLAEDATLVLAELLCAGRVARGERFAFREYRSALEVWREGQMLLHDRLELAPTELDLRGPALFADYTHFGSFVAASPGADAELSDQMDALLAARPGVFGSASCAVSSLVVARVLGHSTAEVRAALLTLWGTARERLLGLPAIRLPGKAAW